MPELDGRVALVTGASRGIGTAVARRLALAGATVAVTARTLDPDPRQPGSLRETVEAIEAAGGRAVPVVADLTDPARRERLVAEAAAEAGPIDVLVNNAAVTWIKPIADLPDKRYRLMLETQVNAPVDLARAVLPGMAERGAGWIVNISSRVSHHPEGPPYRESLRAGYTAYGMCKAALERFSTGLAAEVHHLGVRVNALAPTELVATPGAAAHQLLDYPHEPPEVMAEAVLALATGDITGRVLLSQALLADLGRTPAQLP